MLTQGACHIHKVSVTQVSFHWNYLFHFSKSVWVSRHSSGSNNSGVYNDYPSQDTTVKNPYPLKKEKKILFSKQCRIIKEQALENNTLITSTEEIPGYINVLSACLT